MMDMIALYLFAIGISVKTLNTTSLKLDNQVSVMESHPMLWNSEELRLKRDDKLICLYLINK